MFFDNTKIEEISDEEINDEFLQEFINKKNLGFRVSDSESNRWTAYAVYVGMDKLCLTQFEACSFGYMVSLFFSGMGLSCGTDTWFREDEIELKILNKYNDLLSEESLNDHERKKNLFYFICDLYKKHIDKYAYKTETLSFRTSISTKLKFDNVEGDSFNDKLLYLMNKKLDLYFYKTKNNDIKIVLEKNNELPLLGSKTIILRISTDGNLIIQEEKNLERL